MLLKKSACLPPKQVVPLTIDLLTDPQNCRDHPLNEYNHPVKFKDCGPYETLFSSEQVFKDKVMVTFDLMTPIPPKKNRDHLLNEYPLNE